MYHISRARLVKELLRQMVSQHFILRLNSLWISPSVLLIRDVSFRMRLDYRKVDAVTRKDSSLPRYDDAIDALTGRE